MHSNKKIQA